MQCYFSARWRDGGVGVYVPVWGVASGGGIAMPKLYGVQEDAGTVHDAGEQGNVF